MKRPLAKALALSVSILGGLGLLSCPALAGSYVVSACSPSTSPGLWAYTNTFPSALTAANQCGGPAIGPSDGSHSGALYAEDILNSPATIPDGSRAGWTLTAPGGTMITAISYYRTLTAYNNQDIVSGLFQADGSSLEQCKIPWPFVAGSSIRCDKINNQAPVTFTGLSTSSLFLGVTCRLVTGATACISGGAPLHAATADLYSSRVTLSEDGKPTLSNVGGPLWAGGVISGVVPVTFTASDVSGIQEQLVRSDTGQTLISALHPCDFGATPPCPQQPAATLNVDTRRVADGPQTFSVVVSDPAGNSQIATSPRVVVANAATRPPGLSATGPGSVVTPAPSAGAVKRTKITATLRGRRLRVSGSVARTGRVRVSWRSKIAKRTVAHGSRVVRIRGQRIAVTFRPPKRARSRKATTRVVVRAGRRIVAQARARRR